MSSVVMPNTSTRPSLGPFYIVPRLWRSDARRHKLEPLLPALPIRGDVTFNEDRTIKRDIRIEVASPDSIAPQIDYLWAELHISDSTGTREVHNLGHFLVTGMNIVTTKTRRIGTLQGWDGTYALQQASMPRGVTMVAGADPGSAARDLL